MLSERDRQVLSQIETILYASDPRFVTGMRAGRPRRPREYRPTWLILLLALGVGAFVAVLVSGSLIALFALLAVAIAGMTRFVLRRLDSV